MPTRLLIRVPTLALGYLDRPQAQAENFRDGAFCPADLFAREDPVNAGSPQVDLTPSGGGGRAAAASGHHDGGWRFAGREDSLVKIHGRWVNLVELEERLSLRAPGIAEAAAVCVPDADGVDAVAFFFVAGDSAVVEAALRAEAEAMPPTNGRAGCTRWTPCRAPRPASCCGASCRNCTSRWSEVVAHMVSTAHIGRVLVATLSRPPVNALDDKLIAELDAVVDRAIEDEGIAVLHLRSDQRVFSAGADLALIEACFATPQGPDAMTDVVREMQRLYWRLESAPLGDAGRDRRRSRSAAGCELALACDLRVAALEARLGLPEARLGLLPGAGGTQRLTRLCGPGLAKRLILGAELIDGATAERLGLVQWAVPRDALAVFARGARQPLCRDAEGRAGRQQALHRRRQRPRARRLCRRDRRNAHALRPPRHAPARCRTSWPTGPLILLDRSQP